VTIKRTIKTGFTIISIIAVLLFLQKYVVKPWGSNDIRIKGFYMEPENTLDLVIVGSSETYNAFSPCQAYAEYGIFSYPFSSAQSSAATWKTQIDEIMRTQSPDLIVVEVNGILYRDEPAYLEGDLRLFTNNMPVNHNMEELIDCYAEHLVADTRMSYYLPYIKYHTNILPPEKAARRMEDRISLESRSYTYLKGGNMILKVMEPDEVMDLSGDTGKTELGPEYEEIFRDFLEHCRKNEYPVLFIRAPHCIRKGDGKNIDRFHMVNRVQEIVREYGFDLINFDTMHNEIGIDEKTDFSSSEHLNIYGQRKFTSYFTGLLLDRHFIREKAKEKEDLDKWEICRKYYEAWYRDSLNEKDDSDEEEGEYRYETAKLMKKLSKEIL